MATTMMHRTETLASTKARAKNPSAIAQAPNGGFYVSSVLSGVIAEYDERGRFVRRILDPPAARVQSAAKVA